MISERLGCYTTTKSVSVLTLFQGATSEIKAVYDVVLKDL